MNHYKSKEQTVKEYTQFLNKDPVLNTVLHRKGIKDSSGIIEVVMQGFAEGFDRGHEQGILKGQVEILLALKEKNDDEIVRIVKSAGGGGGMGK